MVIHNLDADKHLNNKSNSHQHLMLFDLDITGHHPNYIRHLVKYYCEQKILSKLDIVVSPQFLTKYPEIISICQEKNQTNIQFVPITLTEYSEWNSKSFFLKRMFKEWQIYCEYAEKLEVEHCLFMYLDHLQLPIAFGSRSPCQFSGIYFRPTFHYKDFDNYVSSWKNKFREWRQKLLLSRVLKNPKFRVLFCLDLFVIKYITELNSKAKITHLPDPVEIFNVDTFKVEQLRNRLAINGNRQVFLLFGSLARRKGIYQLLEAIKLLPVDISQRVCLLLVGSILHSEKLSVETLIKEISQSLPVQIIIRDEYIPEQEVNLYFQISDCILAPYQCHIGMSGILLLAAAAQKPVLASDYGLMGQLVLKYQLGLSFDSTSPAAIAENMQKAIKMPQEQLINVQKMQQLAQDNSSDEFAKHIFHSIFHDQQ